MEIVMYVVFIALAVALAVGVIGKAYQLAKRIRERKGNGTAGKGDN